MTCCKPSSHMLWRMIILHLELRGEHKEEYMKVGESKVKDSYQDDVVI